MTFGVGWGAGAWGSSGWGGFGGPFGPLRVLAALAARENVVQVEFTRAVYFSGLLDLRDASNPARYSIATVANTKGLDDAPVRPVTVVQVDIEEVAGAFSGAFLSLTLDRPMTPWNAQYVLTCSGLYSADLLVALDPLFASTQFPGAFKQLVPATIDVGTPSRDFANPQTLTAALDPLPDPLNPNNLGTIVVDDTGDYAFDEGLVSYKKRIYRRLLAIVGGFGHLTGYGVGVTTHGKKLALPSTLSRLRSEAEQQIAQEPETARVRVVVATDNQHPDLLRFRVLARTKGGQVAKFEVPVSIAR